jgi:hypothetical protein
VESLIRIFLIYFFVDIVIMKEIIVRLVDENHNLLDENIVQYLDIHFYFDKEFQIEPIPYSVPSNTYTIRTNSNYMRVEVSVGRIVLYQYFGEVKNLDIVITRDKIETIKKANIKWQYFMILLHYTIVIQQME